MSLLTTMNANDLGQTPLCKSCAVVDTCLHTHAKHRSATSTKPVAEAALHIPVSGTTDSQIGPFLTIAESRFATGVRGRCTRAAINRRTRALHRGGSPRRCGRVRHTRCHRSEDAPIADTSEPKQKKKVTQRQHGANAE